MEKSTKKTLPRFRTRWGDIPLSAHNGVIQYPQEITPDMGFSTIALARKNSQHVGNDGTATLYYPTSNTEDNAE